MLALPTLPFLPQRVCVCVQRRTARCQVFQLSGNAYTYDASRNHLHVAVASSSTTGGENSGSAIQWPAQRFLLQW